MMKTYTPQQSSLQTLITIRLYTGCYRDGRSLSKPLDGHYNIPDRVLMGRINRWLRVHNTDIRVRRLPHRFSGTLGKFYLIDLSRGWIEDFNINLLDLARYLGLIHEQEAIAA